MGAMGEDRGKTVIKCRYVHHHTHTNVQSIFVMPEMTAYLINQIM